MKKRHVTASPQIADELKKAGKRKHKVFSFFPIDKADCECATIIRETKMKFAAMRPNDKEAEIEKVGHLVCPRDKKNMQKFEITCNACGEKMAELYATDETLTDWCDCHYVQWTDGKEWYGCLTPHISPIDGKLSFECCCGQDTRDFRANMTMPAKRAAEMELANSKGRDYGRPDSKFAVIVKKGK